MRTAFPTRRVHNTQAMMISSEMMLSMACAVLLLPLYGECWRETSTPVQMLATGGLSLVNVGRLLGCLTDNPLPLSIERVYLGLLTVLFATSGGLALTSETSHPDLMIGGYGWDAREVGRAILAFSTMALLASDVIMSRPRKARQEDDIAGSQILLPTPERLQIVAVEDPPPPYAVVVSCQAEEQAANPESN